MATIRLSPSKYDALAMCPRFDYKDMGDGAADEGTLLHKAFETGDMSELDDEQRQVVEDALASVKALLDGWLEWDDTRVACPNSPFITHHETRVTNSFGHSGMMDKGFVNLENGRALIVDLKTGRAGLVADAKDSLQLAGYADAMLVMHPDLKEIMVVLVSPRTGELESYVYDVEAGGLAGNAQRIYDMIKEVENPFSAPRLNATLCTKCRWAAECPLMTRVAATYELPVTGVAAAEVFTKDVSELTPDEMSQNLALVSLIEEYADARRPLIIDRVFQENIDIPYYSRQERAGQAYVASEDNVELMHRLSGCMSAEEFVSVCGRVSLPKAAELLARDGTGTKANRIREARFALEDLAGPLLKAGRPIRTLRRSNKYSVGQVAAGIPGPLLD